MGKKSRSGSGMNIPDHISVSLETFFWDKNSLILWCGYGTGIRNLLDPGSGMEKFGSGINIPDPQHSLLRSLAAALSSLFKSFLTWLYFRIASEAVPNPYIMIWKISSESGIDHSGSTTHRQCCGTVTIFYDSGSDFWKVMVSVPTFEKLWFRFRLLKSYGSGSVSISRP